MALIDDKEAVITQAGKIIAKYLLKGVAQGCSSSVLVMTLVTIMLCWQIEELDLGFIFPCTDGGDSAQHWWSLSPEANPGVAYDDIFTAKGGGKQWATRLLPDEVIRRMVEINSRLMRALRALCLPVGLSKTIVTGFFFDEQRNYFQPDIQLQVFSEKGEAHITFSPIQDIMPHLGITHEAPGNIGEQLTVLELEQEAKVYELVNDPDLHPKMVLDMKVLG